MRRRSAREAPPEDRHAAPDRVGPHRARPGRAMRRLGTAGVLALSLGLGACSAVERRHGYTPDDATLSLIEVGRDTRESVAEKAGDPTALGLIEGGDYYYVSSLRRSFAFQPVEETDREVVAISFDASGRVANVERFGLERGRIVPLSRRVTDTNVQGIGLLRQLFGSLGQISAEDVVEE